MMGFVLDEQIDPSDGTKYNIHIVFRGSRSGWAVRAATQGLRDKGNPDWVTDMDSAIQTVSDDVISPEGKCCRGFCNSIKTIIPTIMISLDAIHQRRQNPPREIYVTGHSLGGALAAHFASAVSMGKKYSNLVQGYNREMPKDVQSWPWSSLKLITYGAPPVGDEDFHYGVNSKVYAKRIVLGNDVITQKRIRYHVGARTNLPSNNKLPNTEDHRPDLIREALIDWAKQWGDYLIGVPTDPPWTECSYFNDVLNHSAFRDDRNQVKLSLNGSFQDNLIEYLEIVREILGLDSSYKRGYAARKETKQKKQTSIQNLITEISNNSQGGNLDDVIATWKQILKDKKQNPIGERLTDFLGLCVVLHGFNIEPDKMDQSLRDNQALNEVITKKL
ncbi:MAG TPA: hypothetical protein DCF68_15765 [Cyanothece sp. UBA12306]|nr:hypothetical protein [Cyanothece sp. UBA12306]